MFFPLILVSDKTTVSVATRQNEYYPLYLSLGNIYNRTRRAHRNGVGLVAFLAIPKSKLCYSTYYFISKFNAAVTIADRKYQDDPQFRKFRRQLFHSSLNRILQALKPAMTQPEVVRCGDDHFRRGIYGLGPYIADYPEQVCLSGIVQGWCPK